MTNTPGGRCRVATHYLINAGLDDSEEHKLALPSTVGRVNESAVSN